MLTTDPSRPTQRTFAPRRDRAVWLGNWAFEPSKQTIGRQDSNMNEEKT